MAGQMNGSDSAPESRDETNVTGVGDVPPRQGILQRAIHEKTAERQALLVIHLPCDALKTHVGGTIGPGTSPTNSAEEPEFEIDVLRNS
jgi:hypothetical protein